MNAKSAEGAMKILLAIDESKYSTAAVREVAKQPWPKGTTVRVLTIAEPLPQVATEPWYSARESLEQIDQEVQKRARTLTKKTADSLKKKGFKVETAVRRGDPRSEIVDEAKKWKADLIVMGSHGYTGIKRLLLGSVASSVVIHAPCSVEIVRQKARKTR
jgi:nucleotide-binding universal stress UspA family protein